MSESESSARRPSLFDQHSYRLRICIAIMFFLAALLRLNDIHAPGHLPDREYTSAIFARAFYFANNDLIEPWEQNIAIATKNQQPILEPPFVEWLVSWIYRATGREELFYSRYLTNSFWLLGGLFMYRLTKRLISTDAAIVATGYYLFVPMGIIISRSFQPDSLMMMLFLLTLNLILGYFEMPTLKRLLAASTVNGLVLLLRPLVIFAVFCSFLALSLSEKADWKKVLDRRFLIFSGLSLVPSVVYYGYGIVFAGFMRWKVTTSFMPYLLPKRDFWLGWFNVGSDVVGHATIIAAIIGFFFLHNKRAQYLAVGLAVSYVLFGIAFTYHIHTHPYYHIQLIPLIGLAIAPLVLSVIYSLRALTVKYWFIPVAINLICGLYFIHRTEIASLYQGRLEAPQVGAEIGRLINHSARTVFVSYYYGVPLEYYGEFGGAPWPVSLEDAFYRRPGERSLSVQERLSGLGFVPDYFVITNFDLYYRKHADLETYLKENCHVYAQKEQYLIYSACKPIPMSEATSHSGELASHESE